MKKLFVLLALVMSLFLVAPTFAGDKTVTIGWEQPAPVPADMAGWKIYKSLTSGSGYTEFSDIAYTSSQSSYTTDETLTSPDGQTTTHYFVLASYDTSGNLSAYSNEVSIDIDFEAPGVPFNVTITVSTP